MDESIDPARDMRALCARALHDYDEAVAAIIRALPPTQPTEAEAPAPQATEEGRPAPAA